MKIIDHIAQANGKTLFSFEILPPKKGEGIKDLYAAIDPLMDYGPSFIDVTYHREEYVLKKRPDGLLEQVTTRKRPGTVAICAAIKNRYKVDTVPHLICGGFSKDETENALIELDFLGIETVLALRGDAVKSDGRFIADPDGHEYADSLIQQVMDMNEGRYLHEELQNSVRTNFEIGAAAYPEKHFEAPNMDSDMHFLKKKVKAGAKFIVTQMFFDNSKYFAFVEKCRAEGITVPIIPGIKPLATVKQLNVLPSIFHIDMPDALVREVIKCKDNAAAKEVGIEWAIQQCKELVAGGAPVLHFYTMSRSTQVKEIAKAVF